MADPITFPNAPVQEPKTVDDIYALCRQTAEMQESLFGQIMSFASQEQAQSVSSCLQNAQNRNIECIDWITHAVAHVRRGAKA